MESDVGSFVSEAEEGRRNHFQSDVKLFSVFAWSLRYIEHIDIPLSDRDTKYKVQNIQHNTVTSILNDR